LENADNKQIIRDVQICRQIPSVEHRVSLCQDLAIYAASEPEIVRAANWAVSDPHPWVRRESLKLFPRDRTIAASALNVRTDWTLFPGQLDLVLEAYRNGADTAEYLHGMTRAEQESIVWAMSVESTHF
jgi:hypothetical protein